MILSLSAITYDPDGAGMLRLRPGSIGQIRAGERRQTKTATLDGGVSLYDTGYTLTDQIWRIQVEYTEDAETLVEHLARNYQKVRASALGRSCVVSIQSWSVAGLDINLALSVLEEL